MKLILVQTYLRQIKFNCESEISVSEEMKLYFFLADSSCLICIPLKSELCTAEESSYLRLIPAADFPSVAVSVAVSFLETSSKFSTRSGTSSSSSSAMFPSGIPPPEVMPGTALARRLRWVKLSAPSWFRIPGSISVISLKNIKSKTSYSIHN